MKIVTPTLNPALYKSTYIEKLQPEKNCVVKNLIINSEEEA